MEAVEKLLSELSKGEKGKIVKVESGKSAQRLMELGLVPGVEVFINAISPFGDPISVGLSDYSLSMRREDAAQVRVQTS